MLTTYLKTSQALHQYRATPAGPHLDAFLRWLESRGYPPRRILHLLRGVHRFAQWAYHTGVRFQEIDASTLDAYAQHLASLQRLRYPSGRFSHLWVGARHFVTFLATAGVIAPVPAGRPQPRDPDLLVAFGHWMQTHRGTTATTLNGYRVTLTALLHTLGEQPERLEARTLRAFVLARVGEGGIGRAKTVVTAVRMFLRFLSAVGRCTPGLDHALPTIAHWRLATLPQYLPVEAVEAVVASCDLTTPIGVRDRAVLVLSVLPTDLLDFPSYICGPAPRVSSSRGLRRMPLSLVPSFFHHAGIIRLSSCVAHTRRL